MEMKILRNDSAMAQTLCDQRANPGRTIVVAEEVSYDKKIWKVVKGKELPVESNFKKRIKTREEDKQ